MKALFAITPIAFALPLLFGATPPAACATVPTAAAPVHCQVPCGIYGDRLRIELMLEDCATVEKGMAKIGEEAAAGNHNQAVRWVVTKDQHAAAIQEQVASYWLAQRIKAPADEAGRAKYLRQLELMHGMTVAAMKCKQTTDVAHVAKLRELAAAFSETYFSKEDLEHIRGHREGK